MTDRDDEVDPIRRPLLARGLALSYFSVAWGLVAGAWAVTAGLLAGSLGVLGLGLNVLADVAGSIGLVWRFGVERRDPMRGLRAEARASIVVASALGLVAVTLTIVAINEFLSRSMPEHSVQAMISAGVSAVVLAPLGWAKHQTGRSLHSHALIGDGTLSVIGAALGVLALLGLLTDRLFGWWWGVGWLPSPLQLLLPLRQSESFGRALIDRVSGLKSGEQPAG
jgi:divalent metal cation (Fe/Co/Zn/Cd) transporter